MKATNLIMFSILAVLLLSAVACGGGEGSVDVADGEILGEPVGLERHWVGAGEGMRPHGEGVPVWPRAGGRVSMAIGS